MIPAESEPIRMLGRYAIHDAIASGGMATVHLARLEGAAGFARTVAIKRLHAQFAASREFVDMFVDEARLAARIRHPNVVPTLDVVSTDDELFLVMEYIAGESLSRIARRMRERNQRIPFRILTGVMSGALHGLHAAHEAKDERGAPLGIVHRDISPHNILLGSDGVPRVLDFGVAKAAGRLQDTRQGQLKGKLSYMPPEQLCGGDVSRQSDIYSAGVVLWELIAGMKLFYGENEGAIVAAVLKGSIPPPSQCVTSEMDGPTTTGELAARLDACVLRALNTDPKLRYASAREFAVALENCIAPATSSQLGEWVESAVGDVLAERARRVAQIESAAADYTEQAAAGHSSVMAMRTAQQSAAPGRDLTSPRGSAPGGSGVSSSSSSRLVARQQGSSPSNSSSLGSAVLSAPPPTPRRRWALLTVPVALLAGAGVWWNIHRTPTAAAVEPASRPAQLDPVPPPVTVVPPVILAPPVLAIAPPDAGSRVSQPELPQPPRKCLPGMACYRSTIKTTPAVDCTVKFRMENGVKRWKPECMK